MWFLGVFNAPWDERLTTFKSHFPFSCVTEISLPLGFIPSWRIAYTKSGKEVMWVSHFFSFSFWNFIVRFTWWGFGELLRVCCWFLFFVLEVRNFRSFGLCHCCSFLSFLSYIHLKSWKWSFILYFVCSFRFAIFIFRLN